MDNLRSVPLPAQPAASGAAPADDLGVSEDVLYRAMFEALPDVTVFVYDADLRYRLVSGGAFARLGWRASDLVGRKPTELLPGREGVELEACMIAALNGDIRQYEHAGIRDPQIEWVSTVAPVRDPGGQIVAGMIVSRDVAPVRRAERARFESEQARRHAVAEAGLIRAASLQLQHGLLPAEPPSIPGLDLAGTYRAASDTAEVGGDWFDAVEVFRGNGGSVVDLVVGDVQGHDGEAAALMARLGSVVRADSQKGRGPVEIVVDLDRFHRSLNTERLTTLALARLHTGTGTVHFVNAGHPPPLLVRNGVAQVATTIVSPPIGAGAFSRQVEQLALQPDDLLVLFSDGLLDPRADTDDALRKLAALATSAPGRALPELVEMLVASTTDHEPSDDVVVLATRWTPGR